LPELYSAMSDHKQSLIEISKHLLFIFLESAGIGFFICWWVYWLLAGSMCLQLNSLFLCLWTESVSPDFDPLLSWGKQASECKNSHSTNRSKRTSQMCSSISSLYLHCISQISQNEVHGGSLSWKEGSTYYRVKAMNTETWEELVSFFQLPQWSSS
jgi:hypothetical protein